MTDTKKVAFLVASEGIEKVELVDPWQAVTDAGHTAVLLSPESGSVQLYEHLDKADTRPVDAEVGSVSVDDYDALVLPGGVANPDALRLDGDAVAFVQGVHRVGPAGRRDLSRTVDPDRGRRGARQADHVLAEPADRPEQRRGRVGGSSRWSRTAT